MPEHFEIKLPVFEGPFDLLLFFIERDELDIHNIPIAKITKDFLEYMHKMEKMNLEVASEFILVASTLMQIKVRMLLPRPEMDEQGNEIDPREELVKRLLEYKRFKLASDEMKQKEEFRNQLERRGNLIQELKALSRFSTVEEELHDLDLYKLLRVFDRVMGKFKEREQTVSHLIVPLPYTLEEQKSKMIQKLETDKKISFLTFMNECNTRIELIFNFIGILELLQEKLIQIEIGLGFNNFWIYKKQPDNVTLIKSDEAGS